MERLSIISTINITIKIMLIMSTAPSEDISKNITRISSIKSEPTVNTVIKIWKFILHHIRVTSRQYGVLAPNMSSCRFFSLLAIYCCRLVRLLRFCWRARLWFSWDHYGRLLVRMVRVLWTYRKLRIY